MSDVCSPGPFSTRQHGLDSFSQSATSLPRSGGNGHCDINVESSCEKVSPFVVCFKPYEVKDQRTKSSLPITLANLPFRPRTGSGPGALGRLEYLARI